MNTILIKSEIKLIYDAHVWLLPENVVSIKQYSSIILSKNHFRSKLM